MFIDCLTNAVLIRLKTHTRRGIPELKDVDSERIKTVNVENVEDDGSIIFAVHLTDGERILVTPKFKIGEIVAISQSYEVLANDGYLKDMTVETDKGIGFDFKPEYRGAGWRNKMFVKAELMPHHIRITNIRAERLQYIKEKDCLCEGVSQIGNLSWFTFDGAKQIFHTPVAAFRALINKLDKKMWERNPWVFVYEFELVD